MKIFKGDKANEIADKITWIPYKGIPFFPAWIENEIKKEFEKWRENEDFESGARVAILKRRLYGVFHL